MKKEEYIDEYIRLYTNFFKGEAKPWHIEAFTDRMNKELSKKDCSYVCKVVKDWLDKEHPCK